MGELVAKKKLRDFAEELTGTRPTQKDMLGIVNELIKTSLTLKVIPYTGDEDLWGKKASDLQEDIAINDGVITGTSKYVENYDPQSNLTNFLVLQATSNIEGATITGQIIGGLSPAQTLDADGIILFKLDPTKTQSIQFVVSTSKMSRTYDFELDLTFETE